MATSDAVKPLTPLQGVITMLPVILGYLPYGVSYGILANQAGLTLAETLVMSSIVYAGTSQIVVVGLMQTGQSLFSLIFATFIVNIRYLLLLAALAPMLARWKLWERLALGFYVSDETFALFSAKFAGKEMVKGFSMAVNLVGVVGWTASSYIGFVASALIPDIKPLGLDFVLPAVFIGLLMILMKDRMMVLVAVVASGLAILLSLTEFSKFAAVIAGVVAATFGVWIKTWKPTTSG